MKKISFFLIALLFSLSSYAQLPLESFESWTPGQGPANWKILQNDIGTTTKWVQTTLNFEPTPPHTGQYAAYMQSQNVSTGIPEDYLVTPLFNSPVNGRIEFYSRLIQVGDQGSIYKVKLLPTGADADDISNYIELQSWTELEINPVQTDYTKVTVEIPAEYEGTNVRIAFVILSDNGDRWLIDDVRVTSQCLDPENLSASNIATTTADLSWDNPSGATEWEIEIKEEGTPATGTGITYNGALPYNATNLNPGTQYNFLVRALCDDGGESEWVGAYNFTTFKPGDNCQTPKIITSLPYSSTDNTANYFDVYQGNNGGCGTPSFSSYLDGNDITYAFTPTQDGIISINVTGITEAYAGIFIYTSCNDIGTNCFAGVANEYETPAPDLNIPSINVTAGTTYYIVISTWFAQTTGFTLNIQQEFCDKPANLTATNATNNGITLGWDSSLSSWQYVAQPVGTGLPMGAGLPATTNPITVTSLNPSTQYEFYVRASCGDGTFSSWAGPLVFNTLCGSFAVPYTEGFNSNSTSQFCWNIADNNNDGVVWDMDFTNDSYEGDQSAKFDVGSTTENDDMLISPAILLTGNERLRFFYKTQQYGAIAFKVMASTTGNAPEDFTIELSPLTSYGVDNFTEKIINLSNLPAGPVYFAWHIPAGFNGGYELMIDNIIVETMPDCAEPSDIVVNGISNNSAHIEWTAGNNESQWEIIVGQADVVGTPGASTTGTPWFSTTYDASGLNSNTLQAVYVRSVCSSTSKSIWQGPYYFTTKCDAFDTPFIEGFNSDSATEQCWKVVNNNGDWAEWNMSDNVAFEGDEAASIYVGNPANDEWLISPAINLTGNERLKFHYKISDANNGQTGFRLLLSTTNSDLSSFTEVLIPEAAYNNEEYLVKVISLEAYTGPVYLAWHVPSTYEFGSDLYIDNVIVEPIPTCPEPLYIEVSNITQTSAEVTWEAGGTETEWELFINIQGEEVPATGISVTSLPFTITELPDGTSIDSGTTYEITVKAVCNSSESSIASDKVVFSTLISNDNCDTAKTIPVNIGPVCDVYASGTLNGATESSQQNPCGDWTSADDDVWFEFTATSSLHTLSLIDITQGAPYLMYIIYEGDDCDNLTQIGDCMTAYSEYGIEASTTLLENLTVGTTYKVRIFSAEATTNQTTTFKVCVKVPVTPIAVNTDQYTVEQLVTDVLFNGDCAQVSNITWSTGTNYPDPDNIFGDNPNGIGYFNQNGSGFPFAEGIVMTTGDVLKVPGPNYRSMEQGSAVWLGDTDVYNVMEGMLGAPPFQDNTNASVIEFDFVPSQPTFSFDFIFASEEYGDLIQCFSYDTFAVLLTDPNGNTQNIAVIPGTQTPISVFSISGAGYPNFCPGYNLDYFDKYNVFGNNDLSSTAFDGQTVVMTASAAVQINQPYHLKIAIAETDNNLDSGVFIKAGINGSGEGSVDLGEDLLVSTNNAICNGQTTTLHTDLDPSVFEIEWSLNDNVIDGETGQDLVVSQPGNYTVSANIIGYNCIREDSVVVEFYPSIEDATGNPADLTVCDADGFAEFDLTQNTGVILEGLNPADYTVSYHLTSEEAANNTGAINSPYINVIQFTQTLYVRIQDNNTLCYAIKSFTINAEDLTPQFTITEDLSVCEGNGGTIVVTPINFNIEDVTFTWTLNGDTLADTTHTIEVDAEGVYEVTIGNNGCTSTATVNVTVIPTPIADAPADIESCDSYVLPALSPGNNYYTQTGGTGTMLVEGDVISATQELFVYAKTATTPSCSDESSFRVTITPSPEFDLGGPYVACSAANVTIEVANANFNTATAIYAWTFNGTPLTGDNSITGSGFGTYTLTVSVNNCTHTESVEVTQDPNAIALLFEEGCEDNVYMLSVIDDNGSFNIDSASYTWTGPNGFTADKREFAAPAAGEYFVTVTTPDGCIGEDSFIVTDTSCDIQRGISPNGDGKNDEFDLATLDVKKLSIFNRYGQEVYTKNNYKKEWIGQTNKGEQLPTGTYFYMIERRNGETNTGWIYINRQE